MNLTRQTKTEIRQIKHLWFVKSVDMNDFQIVHAANYLGALDKVFPPDSEVVEIPVPQDCPEACKAYSITVPKTFYTSRGATLQALVYPVLAVV